MYTGQSTTKSFIKLQDFLQCTNDDMTWQYNIQLRYRTQQSNAVIKLK